MCALPSILNGQEDDGDAWQGVILSAAVFQAKRRISTGTAFDRETRFAILKMNFNFNFKDMPSPTRASMYHLTNGCDSHHMEKSGIKRASQQSLAVIGSPQSWS